MAIKSTLGMVWRNRRHFKMQIFGVMVLFTVMIFIINLITIKTGYEKKLADYMSTNVRYTDSVQMSLSGVRGSVSKIYIDKSRTQCFILLNFSNTDTITAIANNYQMFVTNVDNNGAHSSTPKEQLTGEIYMFGTTGIVGLYLKSDIPFENSLKEIVLRSYSKVTSNTRPYYKRTSTDAEYDQCHLYFNPGGSGSTTIEFLEKHIDGTEFDLTEIYRQVNSVNKEIEIRKNILQFYSDLHASMSKIDEYRRRLVNYNVDIPELPTYIKGDYFDTVTIFNSAGEQVGTYEKYYPATIVPGGTEYDWYMGSILKGYFKLVPNTKSMNIPDYNLYLRDDRSKRAVPDVIVKEWRYVDGAEIVLDDKLLSAYGKQVADDIKLYEKELEKYLELKTIYQTSYLPSLLNLEYDSATTIVSYTVRKDENAVLVY